jgi:hypothetical protein
MKPSEAMIYGSFIRLMTRRLAASVHLSGPDCSVATKTPELDSIERENWRDYVEQQRRKLKIDLSTIGKNLRKRDRTSSEDLEARQKHQAVLAEMNGQELNGAG